MKQLVQFFHFMMRSLLKPAIILPLMLLVCQQQADAACTVSASFKFKDSGGVVYFTSLTTGGANRYLWYFGDGYTAYGQSVSHTYDQDTSGYICAMLYAYDTTQSNCLDTAIRCIYVIGCGAKASYTFTTSGLTATFTNTSRTGMKYEWTFGDATYSTTRSPSHTYPVNGTFSVKLVVIDTAQNCRDSVTKSVTVVTCLADAKITVKDSAGKYYFTNNSTGGNQYLWQFGDLSTSTSFTPPPHIYPKGPSRTVTAVFWITNTNLSGCKDSQSVTVYVPSCFAYGTFNFTTFGYGATFTNPSSAASKFKWTFGDGGTSTLKNPSHTYASLGTYSVKVVVTDSLNAYCKDSMTRSVLLTGCVAKAGFTYKDSGGVYYFTNTSSGANNYTWRFGDGGSSSSYHASHTYAKGASKTVQVVLYIYNTSISGCRDSLAINIFIPGCDADAYYTFTKFGYAATFKSYDSSNTSKFKWTFGDGNTSTSRSPSHTYSSTGTYTVKLVVIDSTNSGCKDSMTRSVVITGCTTKASFTSKDSAGTTYFKNTSTGANQYKWIFGDGGTSTVTNPTHNYGNNNSYVIKLIATNTSMGCIDTLVKPTQIYTCSGVKANFYSVKQGLTIQFMNSSGYTDQHRWNFGDGQTSTQQSPSHTYSTAGTYSVKLWGKQSISYCEDSVTISVVVTSCYPNAGFTVALSGYQYYFTNTSSGANKYKWLFGDGTTSSAYSPNHRYSGSARYIDVTLVAFDTTTSNCNDSFRKSFYYPGCLATFSRQADSSNQYSALIVDHSRAGASSGYLWDFGDGDTSHSKTPTHVYNGQGTYALCLTITDGSCSSTYCDTLTFDSLGNMVGMKTPFSIKVIIPGQTVTSVEEMDYSAQIRVFPNPGSSVVHIESGAWNLKRVGVVDVTGKAMLMEEASDIKHDVNLEHLSSGLYFINVLYENDKMVRIKFIKN